jgi:DNA-binding transcriptional LysR family regulator
VRFSFAQIQAFVAIADLRSFTVAARRLSVSQPALSSALRTLEQELGVRLVERDTRRVTLAPAGEQLLPAARRLIEEKLRAEAETLALLRSHAGVVRIATLSALLERFLADELRRAASELEGISLSLLVLPAGDPLERLSRGDCDIAVGYLDNPVTGLQVGTLGTVEVQAVLPASHPLATMPAIPWRALQSEPLVVLADRGSYGTTVERILAENGLHFTVGQTCSDFAGMAGLVIAGLGLGVTTSHVAGMLLRDGLVARPVIEPDTTRPVVVAAQASQVLGASARSVFERLAALRIPRHG